ncbi:MAG: glucan biosynthesis protein [Pseudomonadota bacterium]
MINRRRFLGAAGAGLAAQAAPQTLWAEEAPSLFRVAARLARSSFAGGSPPLAPPFADLTYDSYRAIRTQPGRSSGLPLGGSYSFDVLPPGLYFPDPVSIDVPSASGQTEALRFSPGLFEFDARYFGEIPQTSPGAGFSGMRLRYPLNAPDVPDEVFVVQGASYFRAIGQAMAYGLSARAVALGTGGAAPEEFPRFTHLRLHRPEGGVARLEAVIDSPSLSGHMEMRLTPGAETVTSLAVTLFPRRDIADIGVAPLTSMYLKGPLRAAVSDDFRPRVHDSDALVIENGAGETLWRPISNPAALQTSAFADTSPRSFGLYQTRRDFVDFEDGEASYHRRPSAKVVPRGAWGPGAVVLVEIPTENEFMDNIVAFWRPGAPLIAGGAYRYAYDLVWTLAPPPLGALRPVLQSRSGREHHIPGHRRFVVDFAGLPDGLVPDLSVSGQGAAVSGLSLHGLPYAEISRATFLLAPGEAGAAELRLMLRAEDGTPMSPVWLHRWTRPRGGGV